MGYGDNIFEDLIRRGIEEELQRQHDAIMKKGSDGALRTGGIWGFADDVIGEEHPRRDKLLLL